VKLILAPGQTWFSNGSVNDVITSAAERQAAAEFARARSVRPQLIKETLNEVGQDREVLDAVFETLEVDRMLKSGAQLTLVPAARDTLSSFLASVEDNDKSQIADRKSQRREG
jgi:hypothetical protein